MVQIVDVYVFVLAATAVLSLGVAFIAWTQRPASMAGPVVVVMLGVAAWCGSEAVLWSRTSLEQQALWLRLTYVGVSVVVVGFTLIAFDISERKTWLTPRGVVFVTVPLALTCATALVNPGGLFYSGYTAQRIGPYVHYVGRDGPLFWVYIVVAYGMLLAGIYLIARAHFRSTAGHRTQTRIMLIGALVPFVVSVSNQLSPIQVEGIESTAFFVTGAMFLFALIRGQLLDSSGRVVMPQDVLAGERRELELQTTNRELEERVAERTVELVATNERLVEANEAMTSFLRSMSHELRTPLNSVIGFSSLLQSGITGELADEQLRQVSMINQSGKHLLALVNDMLDLSKIEAGKIELDLGPVDVAELVKTVVESESNVAESKGLDLRLVVPDEPIALVSDETKVHQILLNLLSNALKYSDRGSVTVRAAERPHGMVALSVSDTGPGISAEDSQRIFGEFTQALARPGERPEGTGLGLAISRSLAVALGGMIELESELDKGSTFTLLLPESPDGAVRDDTLHRLDRDSS